MKDKIQTIHIFKTTDPKQHQKAVTAKVEKLINVRVQTKNKSA